MDKASSVRPAWKRLALWVSGAVFIVAVVFLVSALLPESADAAEATAPARAVATPLDGGTVDAIRRRGVLRCGVGAISEYAWRDDTGRMRGFRADLCRAFAAAVLDSSDAVEFVQLIASRRFAALEEGDVDLLIAGVTWTLTREAELGLSFTTPVLYDGQGFVVRRALGLERLSDLRKPAKVCVIADTTNERNLETFIKSSGLPLTIAPRHTQDGVWSAFLSRTCDIATGDRLSLLLGRAVRTPKPDDYMVLPDMISREPLTPVVRRGDPRWEAIARFVVQALLLAEHKGVTQSLAASEDPEATDPEVRRLLGLDRGIGGPLGLDDAWARRAIATAGNYGELFERTLGSGSRFAVPRGLNALWTDGGLHYPLPLW